MNHRLRGRTAIVSALAIVAASVVGAVGAMAATPPPAPPDAPPGAATTYQITNVHDGVAVGSLTPPLHRAWSRDLSANIGYPLVVNGRVFVSTNRPDGQYGSELWALNADDGSTIWGPLDMAGVYFLDEIAADGAYVYVINHEGLLTALDQATGRQVWSAKMPGQWSFSSAPTVRHGVIYVAGAGSGGTLYAVSAATGGILWTAAVENGDDSSPAVTEDGVYVSYACGVSYRFDPSTGLRAWVRTTGCEGGGGSTPVVHDGKVYVRDFEYPAVLDAATGAVDGTFSSSTTPAFAGDVGFYLQGATLRAVDTATNQVLWSQAGDGSLTTAPIVIGSEVAIGSSSGRIYVVNARTGAVDWSANTGSPIIGSNEPYGMAASDGRLFVPATHTLVAYEHLSADQAFVMALYEDLLGRDTDHAGLAHWVAALDGGRSKASVAVSVALSDEATTKFISDAYESILRRPADDAGLAYWSSRPGGILHANRILDALYASDEYYDGAGGTDAGWVQALYRDALGRPAQSGEETYWATRASSIGRKRVAASIDGSPESADRKVQATYQKLLGRPVDDAGLAYFRTYVDRYGTPFVGAVIAGSTEYADRALTRME
jgi:outer membrane protein assembly factor BamB